MPSPPDRVARSLKGLASELVSRGSCEPLAVEGGRLKRSPALPSRSVPSPVPAPSPDCGVVVLTTCETTATGGGAPSLLRGKATRRSAGGGWLKRERVLLTLLPLACMKLTMASVMLPPVPPVPLWHEGWHPEVPPPPPAAALCNEAEAAQSSELARLEAGRSMALRALPPEERPLLPSWLLKEEPRPPPTAPPPPSNAASAAMASVLSKLDLAVTSRWLDVAGASGAASLTLTPPNCGVVEAPWANPEEGSKGHG